MSPLSHGSARGATFARWVDDCRRYLDAPARDADAAAATVVQLLRSLPGPLSEREREAARGLLHAAWLHCLRTAVPSTPVPSSARATDVRPTDPRVVRALSAIAGRFTDPALRLRDVAREMAVSDCRLTQLLKEATGLTFGAHVHARRIAEARTLLAESTLSVKEIASRVGYSTTTQLDRHFRRALDAMPSEYRAGARTRHVDRERPAI